MATEQEKLQRLRDILKGQGKVAVAYSGGTDSTFLLKVARDELGDNVIAIFNASEVISPEEVDEAIKGARELGAEPTVIHATGMDNKDFLENRPDRCYVCKKALFHTIIATARERGIEEVVDGGQADDLEEDRPGHLALVELGVRSPLAEAGLNKDEIRRMSREMGIRTADKPANPCLATRIPFYEPITLEKLDQIGRAERFIHQLGVAVVRVRHHGPIARIEVPPEEFPTILRNRVKIASEMKALGFTYVDLDLMGFRSGSMSESLKDR